MTGPVSGARSLKPPRELRPNILGERYAAVALGDEAIHMASQPTPPDLQSIAILVLARLARQLSPTLPDGWSIGCIGVGQWQPTPPAHCRRQHVRANKHTRGPSL